MLDFLISAVLWTLGPIAVLGLVSILARPWVQAVRELSQESRDD